MKYFEIILSFLLFSVLYLISPDTNSYARGQQALSICSSNQDLNNNQSIPVSLHSNVKTLANKLIYDNSLFNITITCPNNWEIREGNDSNIVVEFLSQPYNLYNSNRSALGVYVQDLFEMNSTLGLKTLDDYSKIMMDVIRNGSSDEIKPKSSSIDNNLAYKVVYNDKGSMVFQEWTVKNNKAYMLLYLSDLKEYDKDYLYMNRVLESFTIR
ncbi:MAG: hypothetical protein P0116_16415 [Candidatus Nitrosocosmicus sp.]|nr:hypothetical protein [Candidatus Nitrosocosmicus sp.]